MPNPLMLATVLLGTANGGTANVGTPWGAVERGLYTISISGGFNGAVQLQRSFQDVPGTGLVIATYTAATELNGEAAEPQNIRLFCLTYLGGTPLLRVSQ
jgi:hypothetical protein